MALEITDVCVGCYACEPLCPNKAISAILKPGEPLFAINPEKCTECLGDHDKPQCAEICPIEEAIVDEYGEPLNPLGSLTGIPAHITEAYRQMEAEKRANEQQ